MKRTLIAIAFFAFGLTPGLTPSLTPGLTPGLTLSAQGAWKTILDGRTMDQWTPIGMANWRSVDGAIQSDNGMGGFLVSKVPYGDFELRAEVWVTPDANSGIFIRGEDPKQITAMNAYEVNIYDMRPDQAYRTGGIVDIAKPMSMVNAGNQWNTLEITAKGPRLTSASTTCRWSTCRTPSTPAASSRCRRGSARSSSGRSRSDNRRGR